MRRVNIKGANGLYYTDMILINDIGDLIEYEDMVGGKRTQLAGEQICKKIRDKSMKHHTDALADRVEGLADALGCGSLWLLGSMAIKTQQARLKAVTNGHRIAINHNNGWMLVGDDDIVEPVKTIYTEADIKITRFEGGRHYYATIRGIEVKDKFGCNRWNTPEYAESVANNFLNELNEKI